MRNVNRIYPLLSAIATYWYQHPDLRFSQVVNQIQSFVSDITSFDYIEDEYLEKLISMMIEEE